MPGQGIPLEEENDTPNSIPSAGPTPERLLLSRELQKKLEGAMAALSDRERAAFVLRHFDGCSIQEIASALGLQGNTPKTQSSVRCKNFARRFALWIKKFLIRN